jgi:hypothetical protein
VSIAVKYPFVKSGEVWTSEFDLVPIHVYSHSLPVSRRNLPVPRLPPFEFERLMG